MNEARYDRWGLKRNNPRVSDKDAFVLNQRVYLGARPDGDGWETVVDERQWNVTPKTNKTRKNPLNLELRLRPPRKQGAARMIRPVESMDESRVYLIDPKTEMYFDLGRNEAEKRPAQSLQAVRGTNFDMGAKYSGGTQAIREAMKKRKEFLAGPKKQSAEEIRNSKIVELRQRIRALMGL